MNRMIVDMSVRNKLLAFTLVFCIALAGVILYLLAIPDDSSGDTLLGGGWWLLFALLLLGMWFAYQVWSSIVIPLDLMLRASDKIEKGDLSAISDLQMIKTKDEFGTLAASQMSVLSSLKKLQTETNNLAGSVRHGSLNVRCHADGLQGVWSEVIDEVNVVADSYIGPFLEAAVCLDRISHGDIPPIVTKQYPGDFNNFKEGFNRSIRTISDLLAEYNSLIDAAHNGDLTARGDADKYEGCWREFIDGLNKIFATVVDPVRNAGEVLHALSEGDLRYCMNGEYKGEYAALQNSVNTTIRKLESTVIPVQEAAGFISKTSSQIFAGNNSLSDRTDKESSRLQETASSMERLIDAVRNNAEHSKHANNLATDARQSAEHGGEVVNRAVQAMDEINKSSNKIAEIIGVIDDIAFQTNLLALNASVEAARAGEQGRGFAVVATEVRNLAGRSATAAKEIKELIKDSMKKVQAGTSLVNESGETLDEIMDGVKQVGNIISDIYAASGVQLEGIELVNKAVTSMDDMVVQNATLAEKTSMASGSMREKARELDELMQFFKVNGPIVRKEDEETALEEKGSIDDIVPERPRPDEKIKNMFVPPQYVEDEDEWEEF